MHPRRILALACAPALLLATACSSKDEKKPDAGETARIVKFEANPKTVREGETATLSWITEHVSSVRMVDGDANSIDLKDAPAAAGSVDVVPVAGAGAKFTLIAKSESTGATIERTVEIQVTQRGAPRIDEFSATPDTIELGQKAILKWSTTDATRVVIETADGEGIVDSTERLSGEEEVAPNETTRYVLTAYGENDLQVTHEVTVTMEADPTKPSIVSFTATPNRFDGAAESAEVVLAWQVTGANSIAIEAGGALVDLDPESNEVTVEVFATVTFRLVATNEAGSTEAEVTVTKVGLPTVEFTASSTEVAANENFTLQWTTTGAVEVELLLNGQPMDFGAPLGLEGQQTLKVSDTTTFGLRAINEFGAAAEEEIEIVVGTVGIIGVTATPERTLADSDVEIEWTAFGGSKLLVRAPGGDVVEGCEFTDRATISAGSCTVRPDADGTWTYTVELSSGDVVRDTKIAEVVVREGAAILEFKATPVVTDGKIATVSWRTDGDIDGVEPVLTLDVDGTAFDVSDANALADSVGVTMTGVGPHTLTLTAAGSRGADATAEVVVDVVPAATVTLTATPSAWSPSSTDPVVITWTSTNATQVELLAIDDNGTTSLFKNAIAGGTYQYAPPAVPVTFRMFATNAAGDKVMAEAVVGPAAPEIDSFEATETTVASRQATTLSWATTNATSASISPAYGGTNAAFIDVSTTGTRIDSPMSNDACAAGDLYDHYRKGCYTYTFPNGFTFPFGGSDRTSMWIYNNGAIGFGNRGDGSGINSRANDAMSAAPTTSAWVNLAPFWMPLALNDTDDARSNPGKIYVGTGNDTERGDFVVVQWKNMWFTGSNDNDSPTNLNFEVLLFADGSFDYRYGTMSAANATHANAILGNLASIGFQTGTSRFANVSHRAVFPGGLANFGLTFLPETLDANGSWTVVPLATTTYTLTAENPVGTSTETLGVTVTTP